MQHPGFSSSLVLCALVASSVACDPTVDRDNPFDPAAPLGEQAPARVEGAVWLELAAGDGPGPVDVQTIARDGAVRAVAVDPESGGFSFERPAGRYTLVLRAAGYRDERFGLELAIGDRVTLDRRVLLDAGPPVAPMLVVPAAPGPIATPRVAVEVRHPEDGATVELSGDVASVEGDGEARTVELSAGDGLKRIDAVAVDRAGHASATVSVTVRLDTTPPAAGARLRVAGGAPEVRSREVDVDVLDAPADAVRVGLFARAADRCAADDCPALECDRALIGGLRLTLDPTPGPQCVCGVICDGAGNRAATTPAAVTLGPSQPRPVPQLAGIEPDTLRAEPGAATVTVRGAGIAGDTAVDIGPFTGLPCAAEGADDCVAGDPESCARACAVEVPEALRLASGQYIVRLRTPAPVIDGDGRSQSARLTIIPHRPLIDRIEPQGARAEDGVRVTIEGFDLTDNAQFALAGRPPSSVALVRDPERPRAVRAELVFDLAGVPARFEVDARLVVTNPGGDRIELPFGVVPRRYACPPRGPCRVPVRRTMLPGIDGHVAVEATLPDDGRAWSVLLDGGAWWTLFGPPAPDGTQAILARSGARQGGLLLPLPGPQPEATLRADVPAHAGGSVRLETRRAPPAVLAGQAVVETHTLLAGAASAALFADLDDDGERDAVVAHGQVGRLSTVVAGAVEVYEVGGAPSALAAGDLDGDGLIDLVVGDRAGERVRLLFGERGGLLSAPFDLPRGEVRGPIASVAVGDLDGDRLPDVLAGLSAGLSGDGGVLRWRGTADGRWLGPEVLTDAAPARRIAVVDISQDGRPDVVFGGPEGFWQRITGAADRPAEPIVVAGQQLAGEWFAIGDAGRYAIEWLYSRGLDGEEPVVWRVGGHPGDRWQQVREVIADVDRRFEALLVMDLTNDDRGDLIGAERIDAGYRLALVDTAAYDGRVAATPIGLVLPERPIALTTHISPWLVDEVDGADDPKTGSGADDVPDLTFSAVLADGRVVRSGLPPPGPDDDRNPDNERPEEPQPRPYARVDRVFIDVDRDGWPEEFRLADGLLSVGSWLGESPRRGGEVDELKRVVGALSPRAAEIVEGDAADDGADCGLGEPAAGLAVAFEGDRAVLAFGRGRCLVTTPWPPIGAPVAWARTDLRAPVRDVRGGLAAGRPFTAALTESDLRITPAGGMQRSLRGCVRDLPLPFEDAALQIEDLDGDGADDIYVAVGARAWRWSVAQGCPTPMDRIDGPLAWTLGDMDRDGVPDRVDLIEVIDAEARVMHVAVYRGLAPGAFAAEPVGPPIPLHTRSAQGTVDLAIADMNADGLLDVLTAVQTGNVTSAKARLLLGRGDGALGPPQWVRAPTSDEAHDPVAITAVELSGDGLPDAVTSVGDESSATLMSVRHLSTLHLRAEGLEPVTMPAVWVDSVTLLVELAQPAAVIGGRMRGPRGDVVELNPAGPDTLLFWRSVGDAALEGLLGRQPAGEWTVELDFADGPVDVVASDVILGVRWTRARDQPAWDMDNDGIPDVNDRCPAEAAWPPDACDCVMQCVDIGHGADELAECVAALAPAECL